MTTVKFLNDKSRVQLLIKVRDFQDRDCSNFMRREFILRISEILRNQSISVRNNGHWIRNMYGTFFKVNFSSYCYFEESRNAVKQIFIIFIFMKSSFFIIDHIKCQKSSSIRIYFIANQSL